MLHELCDGMPPIPDTLLEHGSDESDCLCLVEGETPSESLLGERAGLKYGRHPRIDATGWRTDLMEEELILFPRSDSHGLRLSLQFDSYLRLRPHDPYDNDKPEY